jgi:DNA repair photolyase
MAKHISGTLEWATHNLTIISGCSHACRYCYARAIALRFGQIKTEEEWNTPHLRKREVGKRRSKLKGRILFQSASDITPATIAPCIAVLRNLLCAGNEVLIVSKPHLSCIDRICDEFAGFSNQILFRFTIGAKDDRVLSYWEPGAPNFSERYLSLVHAAEAGYATSVSCEPCLDTENVVALFSLCEPYITDSFWIGKANKLRQRCVPGTSESEIARIEAGQTDEQVLRVYALLKDQTKVRWKESYCSVLGIKQTVER